MKHIVQLRKHAHRNDRNYCWEHFLGCARWLLSRLCWNGVLVDDVYIYRSDPLSLYFNPGKELHAIKSYNQWNTSAADWGQSRHRCRGGTFIRKQISHTLIQPRRLFGSTEYLYAGNKTLPAFTFCWCTNTASFFLSAWHRTSRSVLKTFSKTKNCYLVASEGICIFLK